MSRLVLSRRIDERTTLIVPASDEPTRIVIEVIEIQSQSRAKLMFDAPFEVVIEREEAVCKEPKHS